MNRDMLGIWSRIEKVLRDHAPETAKTLAGPATEKDIGELEERINLRLPESFKLSLMVHNGQNDPTRLHLFCGDGILLSTTEIAAMWKMLTEIDEGFRGREANWDTHGFGEWWNRNWIPFTGADGDCLCINLDPRLGSRAGEIIVHVHDGVQEPGIAPSFAEWLERLAVRLEMGEFTVEHDRLWLNLPG